MLLTYFPVPISSRSFAHPSLPRPPFVPKACDFTKPKEELLSRLLASENWRGRGSEGTTGKYS